MREAPRAAEAVGGGASLFQRIFPPRLSIGCAGWSIPKEAIPSFPKEGSHLERYSQVLNCCEINSSFYRPHQPTTWSRWADSVPPGFQFSVKMPRTITHKAKLECNADLLLPFLQQISFLNKKRGPMLIQLPPSLALDNASVRRFFSLLRDHYAGEVVVEPRHRDWFDDRAESLLKEFQVARVAADPVCVPAAAHPAGLADLVYFRLHGSPRRYYSAYTNEFLDALVVKLLSLASTGARVWCIFDNTAFGSAMTNAVDLANKLAAP